MKILITGGAGSIGSGLVIEILKFNIIYAPS
jgi:FlaA1/EpsC-like NDP-sugar epimerase